MAMAMRIEKRKTGKNCSLYPSHLCETLDACVMILYVILCTFSVSFDASDFDVDHFSSTFLICNRSDSASFELEVGSMDDPRIGDLLAKHSGEGPIEGGVSLVFMPHDEGVRRNGGRLGARHGPRVFMEHVRRAGTLQNLEHDLDISSLHLTTVGAWMTEADGCTSLEESHEHLTAQVRSVLDAKAIPFVVGGGNDQSYPNARALLDYRAATGGGPVAVVNIDAHLDVRPLKQGRCHSGSPFRLLLEDSRMDPTLFAEFAAHGGQCASNHAQWVLDHGSRILWLKEVSAHLLGPVGAFSELLASWPSDASIFVSFDLDSVDGAHAPGVSCPGVRGLSAQNALDICFVAGANPNVVLMDLSEFNPDIETYRTGKLVAGMFYHFLLGYQSRRNSAK